MQFGDERVTVHGAILCMIGDTPANNFKEGVGFALWMCCMCMVTVEDVYKSMFMVICMRSLSMRCSNNGKHNIAII